MKVWFDSFKILHKLFIENPDNPNFEANDADYVSYLIFSSFIFIIFYHSQDTIQSALNSPLELCF